MSLGEETTTSIVTPESQLINLPRKGDTDSSDTVKSFLNRYFTKPLRYTYYREPQ